MVLTDDNSGRLLFSFNSKLWGYITLGAGCVLATGTYYAANEEGGHWLITSFFGLLTLLFLYSSLYSFRLRRSLEIDGTSKVVNYNESGLYHTVAWRKNFSEFTEVKGFRPITTAGEGGAKKAKSWAIQLTAANGEIFPLGFNQFGALHRDKAEILVLRIAQLMKIPGSIEDE